MNPFVVRQRPFHRPPVPWEYPMNRSGTNNVIDSYNCYSLEPQCRIKSREFAENKGITHRVGVAPTFTHIA